ncbi:MAG TPA: DUF126 domain-containing protein [Chloroflexota bacterium]|nr:DUF126 domain-containing protein [Chloroflexota bacterium]
MSNEPLSFWGGYDQRTGEIIDRRHPLAGQCAASRILAIPFTRGSSTTTAVLLEAVRAGVAPAALVTSSVDHFLVLAAIVADEMYGLRLPLVVLDPADFASLPSGAIATVGSDGTLRLHEG